MDTQNCGQCGEEYRVLPMTSPIKKGLCPHCNSEIFLLTGKSAGTKIKVNHQKRYCGYCKCEYTLPIDNGDISRVTCDQCGSVVNLLTGEVYLVPYNKQPVPTENRPSLNQSSSRYAPVRKMVMTKKSSGIGTALVVLAWINAVICLFVFLFCSMLIGFFWLLGAMVFLLIAYGIKYALEK